MAEGALLKFVVDNWDTLAGSTLAVPVLVVSAYEKYYASRKRKDLGDKVDKSLSHYNFLSDRFEANKNDAKKIKSAVIALQNRYNEVDKLNEVQDREMQSIRAILEQYALNDNKRHNQMKTLKQALENKQTHIDYIKSQIEKLEQQVNKSATIQQETLVLVAEIKGSFS